MEREREERKLDIEVPREKSFSSLGGHRVSTAERGVKRSLFRSKNCMKIAEKMLFLVRLKLALFKHAPIDIYVRP